MIKKISLALKIILLSLFAILVLFPVVYVILSSFKDNMELLANPDRILPIKFTVDNYIKVFSADTMNVGRMFFNSLWFTFFSVFANIMNSVVCGYVFARGRFRGKKLWFAIFSALMFISLGSITIYPTFEVLGTLGISHSLWGLVVMNFFGIPVVNMYLVRSYINGLGREIDEAAKIDGCSFIGILFRIILPLLKPMIMTLMILSFQGSWNSYLMPSLFTISRPEQQTLMVGIMALKNSGEGATSWNLMFAAAVVGILPVMILFILCNKRITKNVMEGAIKG